MLNFLNELAKLHQMVLTLLSGAKLTIQPKYNIYLGE